MLSYIFATQHFWDSDRSRTFVDSEGKFLGCKTTTLEFAGILVPFLSYPELLTNQTIFATQHFWNSDRSRTFVDSEGKFLGCKTTTLEFAGILVPFLSYPELLTDQTVVVQVDNIGCHFAWKNGYARSDNMASILVRTLVLLSEFLNCKVIVNHHPRESSWEIKLADRLSRESSTTSQDRKLVQSFQRRNLPSVFSVWMENPSEDWDLPKKIMSVMSR